MHGCRKFLFNRVACWPSKHKYKERARNNNDYHALMTKMILSSLSLRATFIESVMADFEAKTDSLQNSMDEIANSVNTISHAIEEGVSGVVSAADSTQVLVSDMDKISKKMDENFAIAEGLKKETSVFTKL